MLKNLFNKSVNKTKIIRKRKLTPYENIMLFEVMQETEKANVIPNHVANKYKGWIYLNSTYTFSLDGKVITFLDIYVKAEHNIVYKKQNKKGC